MEKNNKIPSLSFFIGLIISSFILIHIFGFFGFFVAFAYPLWWFFIPQKTVCFFCLHRRLVDPKGDCPVCKRKVTTIYDPPLNSVFFNMLIILVLSISSLLIIFLEIFIVTSGGFNPAVLIYGRRAQFVIPEKNNFQVGKEFYFDVSANAVSIPINVVQADIQFDNKLLEVKSIDTSSSFATIFTQKDYSNTEGWIRIVGGLPAPGYLGDYGQFARIYFFPKVIGVGKINFMETSKLLANDGRGTNILFKYPSSSVFITKERQVLGESTQRSLIETISTFLNSILKREE